MSEMSKDEQFVEYLKMIQNVIDRLAKNSFQIKAWAAALFTATIVLTFSIINILIFIVLIAVMCLLWALDSYYLKQEKLFRKLYADKVSKFNDETKKENLIYFDMDISTFSVDSVPKTMISISEFLYYIAYVITLGIFLIIYLTMNWQILV